MRGSENANRWCIMSRLNWNFHFDESTSRTLLVVRQWVDFSCPRWVSTDALFLLTTHTCRFCNYWTSELTCSRDHGSTNEHWETDQVSCDALWIKSLLHWRENSIYSSRSSLTRTNKKEKKKVNYHSSGRTDENTFSLRCTLFLLTYDGDTECFFIFNCISYWVDGTSRIE